MAGLSSLSNLLPTLNREERMGNNIRKSVIQNQKTIKRHSAELSRDIPDINSNPMASLVKKQQPQYV